MRFAIVAHRASETSIGLIARQWRRFEPVLLDPRTALTRLGRGDVALGRLGVRDSLDGIEDGLWALSSLAAAGVTVLNPPAALIAAHDKLVTARALRRAGLPHPHTRSSGAWEGVAALDFPVVVKPRFGRAGRGVAVCVDRTELELCLERLARKPWFRSHGAVVQELIPPRGRELRLVVAGGAVVGAIEDAGTGVPLDPPPLACELATAAAAAVGGDLVGVDLLAAGANGFVVLEVNGAVEFDSDYSVRTNVFEAVASALEQAASTAECEREPLTA